MAQKRIAKIYDKYAIYCGDVFSIGGGVLSVSARGCTPCYYASSIDEVTNYLSSPESDKGFIFKPLSMKVNKTARI